MTAREVENAADRMIGAAQQLERCAAELKRQAKTMRQNLRSGYGLPGMPTDQSLWFMHKRSDVNTAAAKALDELQEVA